MKIVLNSQYGTYAVEIISFIKNGVTTSDQFLFLELLGKKRDMDKILKSLKDVIRNEINDKRYWPRMRNDMREGLLYPDWPISRHYVKKEQLSHGYVHAIVCDSRLFERDLRYLVAKDRKGIMQLFRKWLDDIQPLPYPANSEGIEEYIFDEMEKRELLEKYDSQGILCYRRKGESVEKYESIFLDAAHKAEIFEIDRIKRYLEENAPGIGETVEMESADVWLTMQEGGHTLYVIEYEPQTATAFAYKSNGEWVEIKMDQDTYSYYTNFKKYKKGELQLSPEGEVLQAA